VILPVRVSSSSNRSRRNPSSDDSESQIIESTISSGSAENADNEPLLARILLRRESIQTLQEQRHPIHNPVLCG